MRELERHYSAELGLLGLIDHAYTPTTELLQNAVVGECFFQSCVGNPPAWRYVRPWKQASQHEQA